MTSPDPDAETRHAEAWLDGLAGRPGDTTAHAEGQLLRAALKPDDRSLQPPPWAAIEARAAQPEPRPQEAANLPRWRHVAWAASLAAVCVVAAAVWAPWSQQGDSAAGPVWRGGSSGVMARWTTSVPRSDAERLAGELRELGATVKIEEQAGHPVIMVRAEPPQRDAVNARLSALETALDGEGFASIQVLPLAGR